MLQSEGTKAGRVELLILSAGDGDPQGYVGKGRSVNPLIDVGEMLL